MVCFQWNSKEVISGKFFLKNVSDDPSAADGTTISHRIVVDSQKMIKVEMQCHNKVHKVYVAVFDSKKHTQMSNKVWIETPHCKLSSLGPNYKPTPPSEFTTFYDKHKEKILVIWDYPAQSFGDQILYEITTKDSNRKQNFKPELHILPLILDIENAEITVRTKIVIENQTIYSKKSKTFKINIR